MHHLQFTLKLKLHYREGGVIVAAEVEWNAEAGPVAQVE